MSKPLPTRAPAPEDRPLLAGVRAVFFDLFDTIIEVDPTRLPVAIFGGREVPSTAPLVHAEARRYRPDLTLEALVMEVMNQWRAVAAEKEKSWIEVSALTRFESLAKNLGLSSGAEDLPSIARRLTEIHMRGIAEATRLVVGAAEILEKLGDAGLGLALISNFDYAPAAGWILEKHGLAEAFGKVIVSESLALRKPHEKLFEAALEHFGVEGSEALHVGDTAKADVWGAGRLGLKTVWINRRGGRYPEEEFPPTVTVEHLAELKAYF